MAIWHRAIANISYQSKLQLLLVQLKRLAILLRIQIVGIQTNEYPINLLSKPHIQSIKYYESVA